MHLQNNKSLFSYQSPSTLKSQVIKGHILTSQEAHNIKIYNTLHYNQGNLKSLMNHQGPTTFLYLTFKIKTIEQHLKPLRSIHLIINRGQSMKIQTPIQSFPGKLNKLQ